LPQPSCVPATVVDPDEFMSLIVTPDSPTKLEDYLYSDRPQLGLHIISFRDKTIVVLYWLHASFDAMAKKAILDAWTLMLQGREDEIPVPQGLDGDPLRELGKHPTEAHALTSHLVSMPGRIIYGFKNILDMVFRKKENRMVCIPGAFIKMLRAEALQELAAEAMSWGGREEEKPFISDGDVLVAWWTRLAISHLPQRSEKKVSGI
jgi:hypothetical protein